MNNNNYNIYFGNNFEWVYKNFEYSVFQLNYTVTKIYLIKFNK